MTNWTKTVREYLSLRRALGFKLEWAGTELADFARMMQREAADYITVPVALKWAHHTRSARRSRAARRLSLVRGFARYMRAADSRTEVPPDSLLPYRPKRARPYLYTDGEISALLSTALQLSPDDALRRWTYYVLFGLLSVSGLRIREALNLRLSDVDLQAGVLQVQKTKMGQSRLVPLHDSAKRQLGRYRSRRDRYLAGREASDYFFVSKRGNRLDGAEVRRTFYRLSRQIGLRGANDSHGPRIHDIRHRFATRTLINWYRSGVDAERRISVLSTYLGHVHVADTYWYLTACPELMGCAVKQLERRWNELS
jgi:integrase/recombinase XerD